MHLKLYYYSDYLYHFFHIPCPGFDSLCSFIDGLFPKNSCSSMVHHIVKRAVKEYNKKSNNPFYYYPVNIVGVDRRDGGDNFATSYRIYVTLGLTTIKKSKVKPYFVIFPSCFEADKTLRKDIFIKYICSIVLGSYDTYYHPEELSIDNAHYDKLKDTKRLKKFPTIYHRDGAPVKSASDIFQDLFS